MLQLSLNLIQGPEFHFALGEKLKYLRREGILIIGSGNIVHNLRRIDFADNARPLDWALEFDTWVKERLQDGNYKAIVEDARDTEAGSAPCAFRRRTTGIPFCIRWARYR